MQVKECDPNMEKGVFLSLSPPVSDSSGDNTALKPTSAQGLVLYFYVCMVNSNCVCIVFLLQIRVWL